MVGTEPDVVERGLREGRLACPTCRGVLRPWGHARPRVLRFRAELLRLRPRRSRCRSCAGTHVLLAESMLLRRADAVEVGGAALTEAAAGAGHRRVAVGLARAAGTVRGWLRRFAGRAQAVRAWFTALAAALDPELGALAPAGSVLADAVAGGGGGSAGGGTAGGAGPAVGVRGPGQRRAAAGPRFDQHELPLGGSLIAGQARRWKPSAAGKGLSPWPLQALVAAYAADKTIVDESAARTAAAEVTAD